MLLAKCWHIYIDVCCHTGLVCQCIVELSTMSLAMVNPVGDGEKKKEKKNSKTMVAAL